MMNLNARYVHFGLEITNDRAAQDVPRWARRPQAHFSALTCKPGRYSREARDVRRGDVRVGAATSDDGGRGARRRIQLRQWSVLSRQTRVRAALQQPSRSE